MKNDLEIREAVRAAIDDCTRSIDEAPSLRLRVLQKAKGEPPVKKKFTAAMALAIALILLTSSALAATLIKPDILSWLFRGEEAPEEMLTLVQPNGITRQTENAALTLNETFFDGEKLTVSLTLLNPTDEPLVYTIHHAKLNDKALVFETAQLPYGNSVGQALGGEVNGTPIPRETTFFVTFNGTDDPDDGLTPFVQKKPLQSMAEATISIRVDVFRPLAEYTPVSEIEFYSGKYDIITDLVPLYPETAWVNMNALLHPAKLKIVDHLDFSFPISLNEPKMTTVSAVPGEYKNDLYTLSLDSFTLKSSAEKWKAASPTFPIPCPSLQSKASFPSSRKMCLNRQRRKTITHWACALLPSQAAAPPTRKQAPSPISVSMPISGPFPARCPKACIWCGWMTIKPTGIPPSIFPSFLNKHILCDKLHN